MTNEELIIKVNSAIKTASGKQGKVTFDFGGTEKAVKIIKSLFPYGKIAVFYNGDTFLDIGKNFSELLIKNGNKPINFVLEKGIASVKDGALLSGLPEDVRAICAMGSNQNELTAYLANIRSIPLISIVRDYNIEGILNNRIFVLNGNRYEQVFVDIDRTVIFDLDEMKKSGDLSAIFSDTVSNILALSEYRLKAYFENKVNDTYYIQAKKAVISAFKIFNNDRTIQSNVLLFNALTLEIANYLSDGELLDFSSVKTAKFIYKKIRKSQGGIGISLLTAIVRLFKFYTENSRAVNFNIPDYNARADEIFKTIKLPCEDVLNAFLSQKSILNAKADYEKTVIDGLSSEISTLYNATKRIKYIFITLGGCFNEDFSALKFALKHSGDIFPKINLTTVIREGGLTELL